MCFRVHVSFRLLLTNSIPIVLITPVCMYLLCKRQPKFLLLLSPVAKFLKNVVSRTNGVKRAKAISQSSKKAISVSVYNQILCCHVWPFTFLEQRDLATSHKQNQPSNCPQSPCTHAYGDGRCTVVSTPQENYTCFPPQKEHFIVPFRGFQDLLFYSRDILEPALRSSGKKDFTYICDWKMLHALCRYFSPHKYEHAGPTKACIMC